MTNKNMTFPSTYMQRHMEKHKTNTSLSFSKITDVVQQGLRVHLLYKLQG